MQFFCPPLAQQIIVLTVGLPVKWNLKTFCHKNETWRRNSRWVVFIFVKTPKHQHSWNTFSVSLQFAWRRWTLKTQCVCECERLQHKSNLYQSLKSNPRAARRRITCQLDDGWSLNLVQSIFLIWVKITPLCCCSSRNISYFLPLSILIVH